MRAIDCLSLLFVLVSLIVAGCKNEPSGAKDKIYEVKGKVVAVDAAKKEVKLDHEDIPGLMKAMLMSFSVEDAKLLQGIQPGDQVHGRLKVQSGSYTLTELQKL